MKISVQIRNKNLLEKNVNFFFGGAFNFFGIDNFKALKTGLFNKSRYL